MNSSSLRSDALAIWQAGVDAVRSDLLVVENVRTRGDSLVVGDERLPLASIGRIVVIGAGKAGAGMAAGLEQALGPHVLAEKQVAGWVNVPADCVRTLLRIHLHAARPAGVNEPTPAGVFGTEQILELVGSLGPRDLCFCLISGGGSALLPAPVAGVTLADKQMLTRHLSGAGANIQELNTVRKQLSRMGQVLWDANVKSVNERYRETGGEEQYTHLNDHRHGDHVQPVQVLKAVRCLEYQSSEFAVWE
ncbi:MAG: DUF4147 domain-containing protein, partial [Pirellulaceae bacterium]